MTYLLKRRVVRIVYSNKCLIFKIVIARLLQSISRSQETKKGMQNKIAIIGQRKKIVLIAHYHKKPDLLEWV